MLRLSNSEFDLWMEKLVPLKLDSMFPRDDEGIWSIDTNADLRKHQALQTSLLAVIPVVGSAIGLAKLFSVWAAYSTEDPLPRVVYYTAIGILEFLGLGILAFVLKICYLCINIIKENVQRWCFKFFQLRLE